MSNELGITTEIANDIAILAIAGEVDIYTAQELKNRLYEIVDSTSKDIVIDCSNLNYIDSTGLGIFVGAFKKAKADSRNIKIVNIKDNIRKLFIITGLDKLFILG